MTADELPPVHLLLDRDGELRHVTVRRARDGHTLRDLLVALPELRGGFGDRLIVDGIVRSTGSRLTDVLRHGSTLTEIRQGCAGQTRSSLPLVPMTEVEWIAGPDAGRIVRCGEGRYLLGSSPGAALICGDPTIARHQGILIIGSDGLATYEDLTIGRPSRLNGRPVDGRETLSCGDRLDVGSSSIVARRLSTGGDGGIDVALAMSRGQVGTVSGHELVGFPRSAVRWTDPLHHRVRRQPIAGPAVVVPSPADESTAGAVSAVGLISVAASLAGGGAIAVLLRQPLMILMVAIGAVGAILTWAVQAMGVRRRRRRHESASGLAWDQFHKSVAATHQRAQCQAAEHPGLIGALTAAHSGVDLWTERSLTGCLGLGDLPWSPPLTGLSGSGSTLSGARLPVEAQAILDGYATLSEVPVVFSVAAGQTVGIVGEQGAGLLRSLLVQLAVAQGPSQWRLTVVADDKIDQWREWSTWLPHAGGLDVGASMIVRSFDSTTRQRFMERRCRSIADTSILEPLDVLVIVNPQDLIHRTSELRRLLATEAEHCAVIVMAATIDELPLCTDVIEAIGSAGSWTNVASNRPISVRFRPAGASVCTARAIASRLARFADPEVIDRDGALPQHVDALEMFGPAAGSPAALVNAWSTGGPNPAPRTLIGVAGEGAVDIDLERDGPHVLVAGTTGAGKSEMLRTMIAGLAVSSSPEHLQLLLIDYKGGSAFDACAALPHVAGVVTDLDDRLAERVLRSLNAELARRERLLRSAGAENLAAYRLGGGVLARLVIAIDEFASLAHELPDFLPSIVDVARRGRSLGVHLVLATQRPAGVIDDEIRANTNLRIALRLQEASDSVDVIGSPDAALLSRQRPGRAVIRFGTNEFVELQIARCTALAPTTDGGNLEIVEGQSGINRHGSAMSGVSPVACPTGSLRQPTSLDVLVERIRQATRLAAARVPARPWLPPLPERLSIAELPAGSIGLADDPDRQTNHPISWLPTNGHLVIVGALGSGASSALSTLSSRLAATMSPSELHLYVLEQGNALAELADLAHCGGRVSLSDEDRVSRMIDLICDEIESRLSAPEGSPDQATIVVLIDGGAVLRGFLLDHAHGDCADRFERIATVGPQVGVVIALAGDSASAVPGSVLSRAGERWVLSLNDPFDAALLGVEQRRVVTCGAVGRAIAATTGWEFQLADPSSVAQERMETVARWGADRTTDRVEGFPRQLRFAPALVLATELRRRADEERGVAVIDPHGERRGNRVPGERDTTLSLGLDLRRLRPRGLVLRRGDHALIAGTARSGRSSLLALLATEFRLTNPTGWLGIVGHRSNLFTRVGADAVGPYGELVAQIPGAGPGLLLVDDAEQIDDVDGRLAALLGSSSSIHVVAAGRTDALRASYGHWTTAIRRQRRGLLLGATHDLDADLFSAVLPRRVAGPTQQGRGWLIQDGAVEAIQVGLLDELAA